MLVIFVALSRIFSSLWDLHISQAFDAPSSNLERQRLISDAALVGGHLHSRSCVMPSIIIGVNILNWYGAVIAQSGRQFDESGVAFSGTM